MDFEPKNIAPAFLPLEEASTSASFAVEAAIATVAAAIPARGALVPTPDGQLILPPGVGLDDIKVSGRDLIIQMPDGTQMIVPDGAVFIPQIVIGGIVVPPLNLAALLIGQEIAPAAGRPQSSGGNFADPVGQIGDPFARGDLLPPTALEFGRPQEREVVPGLNDKTPTTIIITPNQPAGSVNATATVDEAALPSRGSEPAGSNATSNAETTTGSILFAAPDGLLSIALNGTVITAVGQTIVTPLGILTITSIASGNVGYSYTLTDNTTAATSNDVFVVVVTDRDGDTAIANLTINIIDDVPTARNDTDSVPAGTYTAQTGNVVTGAGTTSGTAGADTQGADGAAVSGVRAGITGNFTAVGTTINGQYGTLTLGANGSYIYTRNAGTPGGVNDVFTYQLTDGDGDTSTATLTINIADSPATITFVPTVGEGTMVSEVGLPARGTESPGSNPALPVEATSGTITYVAPDGPAVVQISGVTITAIGQTITTPTGVLTITNVAPGTIGYIFTLTDNTSGDTTNQTFTVTVTDVDGDTATASLVINIVDDAPTARDDAVTQIAENTDVTVNVIANDTQGADSVSLLSGVAVVPGSLSGAGTVVYNGDGTFTYTPAAGEEGTVTFRYTITDGDGDPSTATVTITLARDSVPFIEITGDRDVAESGLPARGSEPAGSDAAANSEIANGTINLGTGNDTVGSLIINGVNVTAGGTVAGASGTLAVTLSAGVYNYSYTLTDNTFGNATTDSFTVILTDSDGDVANSNLVIAIIDDAPTAFADTDSIAAGSYAPATGNVITDSETDGGRDTQGADGVTVTAIAGSGDGVVGGITNGIYGVLTLNADGSYSYVRSAGTPGGVSDVFNYTITDADGDTSTTTLTVSIADSPTTINVPPRGAAGTLVAEAGLPAGSDATSNSETTNGMISYSSPDGPGTVTIDGIAVSTIGQVFIGSFGTLTITSIANGAIGYSYTLTTNTSGDATFDDFAVVITDQDGDNSSTALVIDIVDDVPTARADVDSVTEDDFFQEESNPQADGNVLTGIGGVDANATDGVADIRGADGATVTSVSFGATSGVIGSGLAGAYGELVLNADGSYTYVLNANYSAVIQGLDSNDSLSEVFTYTITDGDGDISTTTLTITINGANDIVTINGLDGQGAEETLLEANLADGSAPSVVALTQTGSFSFNAVDGATGVTLGGQAIANGLTISSAYGTLTVTGYTPSLAPDGSIIGGTVNYSYTLNDNTLLHTGPNDAALTDSFAVVITDTDGSTDTASLDITIVDDVPTAVNDSDTIAGGSNAPATGNVITDAEADGGMDSVGADGVVVSAVSGVSAGTVNGTTTGLYGVLTLNADGSYSYVRNDGTPGNVTDTFNYTITDGDGDVSSAILTINIEDARPIVGANLAVGLDDDALSGGNAGGTGDDPNAVNISGTLSGSGGDGALIWSYQLTGAPSGFTYAAGPGGSILVNQGATTVLTITLNSATGAYTVTQNAPIVHATGAGENNQPFTLNYTVTDIDGDVALGTLSISVDDDTPTAVNDLPVIVAEDLVGTVGGNVMSNDSAGADGATMTSVTIDGVTTSVSAVGTTTVTGIFGSYTFTASGNWTFDPNPNLNNASGVDASFSYVITDRDGDTATAIQGITVTDGAGPTAGAPITLALDDQNLADGSTPSGPDSASSSILFTPGSDNIASIVFSTDLSGLGGGLVWTRVSGTQITGSAGAVTIVTLNLSIGGTTATVTATLNDNYASHPGINVDDLVALGNVGVVATDIDGDTATGTVSVTVSDDVPTITSTPPIVGALSVDESNFATNATANFAGLFAPQFNADGPAAANAITYALGINAGATGLVDTATGQAVVLSLAGGAVEGRTTGGILVFTVTVNAITGQVTLDQIRAVVHSNTANPDDSVGLAASNLITLGATVTDGDGDRATAIVNIANAITFRDDGPSATNDIDSVTEDGPLIADGNVLTGSGGSDVNITDGVVDLPGADGGNITAIAFGATNGTVGSGLAGNYGTLTLGANGSYSYVLNNGNPAVQGLDSGETLFETFTYTLTDGDGDSVTATLRITINGTNDAPVAVADTNWVIEDGAAATGNVLQTLPHIGAPSGTFSDIADTDVDVEPLTVTNPGIINGLYGQLVLGANGAYTYTLYTQAQNAAAFALVQALDNGDAPLADIFTYNITDGTTPASATLTISVFGTNDAPVVGSAIAVVSEEGLSGGIVDTVGSPTDTTNSITATGTISITDIDNEPSTVTLGNPGSVLTADGLPVTWTGIGTNLLIGSVGATEVIRIAITNTGSYTVTLSQSIDHPTINAEDIGTFTVPVSVSDGTATVGTTLSITTEDDSPIVAASAPAANILTVDETTLATNATANFSGLFVGNFGADGAALAGATAYTLGFNAGITGIVDTATNLAVVLSLESGQVVGRAGVGGAAVFTVSVNATGTVTLDQIRAVVHSPNTGPNQALTLAAANLVTLTATLTDGDGDTASATTNIGSAITFLDDIGSLGAFTNAIILNAVGVVNGTFVYNTGADGHGSFAITPPAITGITYATVQNAAGALLTATADPDGPGGSPPVTVFTLQVNSNGTYAFNLVTPQAASTSTVSLLGLSAGGPTPFLETADGRIEFTGSGSGINSSTQGFGVSNQFVANGESFTMEFHNPGQVGDQSPNTNPQFVDAVTLRNDSINGSLTITWTATNTVTGQTQTGTTAVTGTTTLIDPTISFNLLSIVGTGGSGQGVRFTSVDLTTTVLPADLSLDFQISATDRDGDVTSVSTLNVFIDTPTPPIVLDLDGNGVQFLSTSAGVTFDYAGDGSPERTAWISSGDGLLALDRNGDHMVNDGSEIVFGANGQSDLQGLAAAYDTNGDGQLSAADAQFSQFGVWQDTNSNGISDAGEFQTLTQAGITSIGLVADGISYLAANGEVAVAGQALFTRTDGSNGIVADVAFATAPSPSANAERTLEQQRGLGVNSAVIAASLFAVATEAHAENGVLPVTEHGAAEGTTGFANETPTQADLVEDTGENPVFFADAMDAVLDVTTPEYTAHGFEETHVMQEPLEWKIAEVADLLGDSVAPLPTAGQSDFPGSSMSYSAAMEAVLDGVTTAQAIVVTASNGALTGAILHNALPDALVDHLLDALSNEPLQAANDQIGAPVENSLLQGILDHAITNDIAPSFADAAAYAAHLQEMTPVHG
jgi:large repetitive protein